MSWKKRFKLVNEGNLSPISGNGGSSYHNGSEFKHGNYQSPLPDVYSGHPNRVDRYNQYENMDMDSEVNAALDIIAEFCTQTNTENSTPFELRFKQEPTDTELTIINEQLKNWTSRNDLNRRMFKLFRNTLKYGDQIFIRDPETYELYWTEISNVLKVIVNESEGKKPEQYVIKDINPNFENLTITADATNDIYQRSPQSGGSGSAYTMPNTSYSGGTRFDLGMNEKAIEAQHIVHFSLTEGLDAAWPFGNSILENVFKVFKQKELLEDAIIIYRVQRAPERRVFKIDVGNMPSHLAMQFVERIKNEIHQRRIPTQSGGGTNMMDATYNPLSINEDYYFPQTADGRGSTVETLPGGENLGQIDDLRYFTNKLYRALRIPSSYLPTGPDDSAAAYSDGRVGSALIQENRFNEYCKRLQKYLADSFDLEFKMFMRWRGYNIDNSLFELKFTEPQNFAAYREIELDNQRINAFNAVAGVDFLSKRFIMQRYLGLTETEISDNERMWLEENDSGEGVKVSGTDLRASGISPSDIESDIDTFDTEGLDIDTDDTGDTGETADTGDTGEET